MTFVIQLRYTRRPVLQATVCTSYGFGSKGSEPSVSARRETYSCLILPLPFK
uniref:Uncharacterized protein n=1 Tax=Arundo donax TaxID=35708 RepID=A0A0A9EG54_ARUDO